MSTVQDLGRTGYQRFGVSVSGAADRYALRLGNLLVGNDQRAASLEVTLGATVFEFSRATTFAVTGADLNPSLNGYTIPMWQTISAADGDRLALVAPATTGSGLRAYVNVSGGIDTPPVLGSRSTHISGGLGGLDGGTLKSDDVIPVGPVINPIPLGRRIPEDLLPMYGTKITARVVIGPQDDHFDAEALDTFFSATYTVTNQSDRMGCRLDGPEIPALDNSHDIVSDGVVTGAIQIPGDAKPIIMLTDHQTTGGYAKIGVIASVDLILIAQAAPGSSVRFERITVDESVALAKKQMASLRDIKFDQIPASDNQHIYDLRIGENLFHVDISMSGGDGRSTATVNGVRYSVEVDSGE